MKERYQKYFPEDITIPLSKGDNFLFGKWKNKKGIVDRFDKNEKGEDVIITDTGKEIPLLKIRLVKERYQKYFNEEMLNGFAKSNYSNNKSMVWKIESLKEFKQRGHDARGIIVNNTLYMINGNTDVIHEDIIKYLQKNAGIKFPSNPFSQVNRLDNLNKFLCIQEFSNFVYLSESYFSTGLVKILNKADLNKEEQVIIDNITNQFKVLDKLHIPYVMDIL